MKSFNYLWIKIKNTNPFILYIEIIVWSMFLLLLLPWATSIYALINKMIMVESMPVSSMVQITLLGCLFSVIYLGSLFVIYKMYKWFRLKVASLYISATQNLKAKMDEKKGELLKRLKREV
ncbi:hypothetical protein CTH30272_03049 [Allocatenococcus thiocycli]|nr:hypothetical protein CTH30272_03049 [Catenococcus thiocycli]